MEIYRNQLIVRIIYRDPWQKHIQKMSFVVQWRARMNIFPLPVELLISVKHKRRPQIAMWSFKKKKKLKVLL